VTIIRRMAFRKYEKSVPEQQLVGIMVYVSFLRKTYHQEGTHYCTVQVQQLKLLDSSTNLIIVVSRTVVSLTRPP